MGWIFASSKPGEGRDMNSTLRKLAASVVLGYADGTEAQTLVGTDFILEKVESGYLLLIDLSSNLLPRNRGLLCYYEAQGLLQQHAQLTSIRLNEKELVNTLGIELAETPTVRINISLGDDKRFTYTAAPEILPRSMVLAIQKPA